MLLTTDGKEAY